MNPSPELNTTLKQLRLSGVLDSLEQRNRQAIDGKFAYTEFLAMLLHDEVARRDQKKLGARILRAGFALGKTLESFDFDRLPKLNRAHIYDLATGRYIDEKVAILMVGQTGVGKSHIAQALGHCAARQGRDVVFVTQTDLLKKLHAARATGMYERKFQQFVRVPLLIVDDFALKPLRAPHDEDFHDLVAARYERAATILTSNLDLDEWGDAFPDNRVLGAATLDRLRHGCYRIVLEGIMVPRGQASGRWTLVRTKAPCRSSRPIRSTSNKQSRLAISGNPLFGSNRSPLSASRHGVMCDASSTCLVAHHVTAQRPPHSHGTRLN